jgi:hypothetical protein
MKNPIIRTIYLYLFALIGLAMLVVGTARIIDVGLKAWVFTEADNNEYYEPRPLVVDQEGRATTTSEKMELSPKLSKDDFARQQRHRDLASALSTIIVGLPLYMYHWSVIKKDNRKNA